MNADRASKPEFGLLEKEAALDVERLLAFGLHHGLLDPRDACMARNSLLDKLALTTPSELSCRQLREPIPEEATDILERLLDYAAAKGLLPMNTPTYRDLLDTRLMGAMMPPPSSVMDRFLMEEEIHGVEAATAWFYKLNCKADYIRVRRVARNLAWDHDSPYGTLRVTINLAKPEKDPREIAALRNAPSLDYPKCMICRENVGYTGRVDFPARQTLRTIPLTLNDENWYFQYSPYVYFPHHCIVFYEEHVPMRISRATFQRLLAFVERFPHYFLGSNADLPVVGGSILNHDHFQGGQYAFPIERCGLRRTLMHPQYPNVQVAIPNWPMATVRLTCAQQGPLVALGNELLSAWRLWNDPSVDVVAYSGETPHNTVTPIARRTASGDYQLDLVLRNNRVSDEHPLGIFHPHTELHHIKRENIGLIEVMGLFILPGRLLNDLNAMADILSGKTPWEPETTPMQLHRPWLDELVARYGTKCSYTEARTAVMDAIGDICTRVLENAGVFKDTPEGNAALNRFLASVGYRA